MDLLKNNINENDLIICSCEGSSEENIINILLENHQLIFTREQLIGGKCTRMRKAKDIQTNYLNLDYGEQKIKIIRILDSKNENFKLIKPYSLNPNISVINIYTRPEIEILIIIHKGEYDKYANQFKSNIKPSLYCKNNYKDIIKTKDLKKYGFMESYFDDMIILVKTLKEYKKLHKKNEYTIADLLI